MKKWKLTAILLALACLLPACQASQPQATEPSRTEAPAPTETAPPETEPAPPPPQEETTQPPLPAPDMTPSFLRIRDGRPGIIESLQNDYTDVPDLENDIPSIHIRDAEGFEEFCNRVNSAVLSENGHYDADFFAQCDLLVIPRTTTSGSVRHSVQIEYGDMTLVTVTAEYPEFGTSDMCDWLLLVPIEKHDAPAAAVMEGGWTPNPGNLATE